jgi:hypothetical protein
VSSGFQPRVSSQTIVVDPETGFECDCMLAVLFLTKTSVVMTDEGFLLTQAEDGERGLSWTSA